LLSGRPQLNHLQYLMRKVLRRAVAEKIERLRLGNTPRVLDLFSGCGGLSLGFQRAGFEISAAVEFDEDAALSHGINFHHGSPLHNQARDITFTNPSELVNELGLGPVSSAFDIIVGGPPCQAFARVGRSKLREVAEHPEAFRHDKRAKLYIEYLDYVTQCAPLAVVMENVPDMLNHGGHNIAEEISEVLEEMGYTVAYTLLNAAFYGVPQMRERMFLVAYLKGVSDHILFPQPTNYIELPSGYDGSRAVALKMISENPHLSFHYKEAPKADKDSLPPAISARQAIGDLPRIDARAQLKSGALKRGARRFDEPIEDNNQLSDISEYARQMRHWPGYENKGSFKDHVIRYLPRDYNLFARMNEGDQYPQAYQHAEQMFQEKLKKLKKAGEDITEKSKRWKTVRSSIVPPYADDKFPNKWRKMEADLPSRTLLAHLGKDGYSHIHYDSKQARTISVREAARLQSFPDGFVFSGTMNPAFKQIGNAVPPLLAFAVAQVVKSTLSSLVVTQKKTEAELM
jgi:DNA (cytosine-5)-methyltransferase 1